jgi:hypothetical protein
MRTWISFFLFLFRLFDISVGRKEQETLSWERLLCCPLYKYFICSTHFAIARLSSVFCLGFFFGASCRRVVVSPHTPTRGREKVLNK